MVGWSLDCFVDIVVVVTNAVDVKISNYDFNSEKKTMKEVKSYFVIPFALSTINECNVKDNNNHNMRCKETSTACYGFLSFRLHR